jgi:hypothetical protein
MMCDKNFKNLYPPFLSLNRTPNYKALRNVVLTLRTTELTEKNADIKLSIFTYRCLVYSLLWLLLYEYPLFPSIHPTFIKTEAS